MSSPAKRRKTNKGSSQPVKSLDFFFAKQTANASAQHVPKIEAGKTEQISDEPVELTDEQLARKLQAEWDQESSGQQEQEPETLPSEAAASVKEELEPEATISEAADTFSLRPPPAKSHNFLALQSSATDEDAITSNLPFDESPLTFDPQKYIPDLQQHWAADKGQATYALLTRCFVLVNATTSRIKIVDTLVNMLRIIIEADPDSLLAAVWLATNSISPPYIDLELGLGGSAISKALKKTCGLNNESLRTLSNKYGDAGDVAFEAKKRQLFTLKKPKPLTIQAVFDSLVKIAKSKGQGSQEAKQRIVERLVLDTRGAEESRYIVRTLVQHLRIGAVKTTMLIALSRAFLLSRPKDAEFLIRPQKELSALKKEELTEVYQKGEEIVKASFARHPNYADLIPALLEVGVCDELLLRCGLTLHIPMRPMLGSITRDLSDMLERLKGRDFSCEYKYDGQRAQVHCDEKGKVTIFSRHLELMTDKYPDLVDIVPKIRGEGVSSFILEGEVVAVDSNTGELKTFQALSNRARKDVELHAVTVNVCLFSFDLMYLNGEELMDRPFRERRSLLKSLFIEVPNRFTWVKNLDAISTDSDAVLDFFKSATEAKCEGIMVKVLDNQPDEEVIEEPTAPQTPTKSKTKKNASKKLTTTTSEPTKKGSRRKALLSTYTPDKRLESWLKVKKDYATSADTIDLIPIGAWHGSGRKAAWWSPILLAARNPDTGALVAVTKCMSGFTDAFYKANRAKYDPGGDNVISRPAYIDYAGEPTVWFAPQEVWEVAFADITMSPTYNAALGLVSDERGLSLRFPRFLRTREDKSIEEASTESFLADLWFKQAEKAPAKEVEAEDDEE
ncbi:ATP-dependent DNA ligase [Microthyrium microscopicum]|uniref:DNA ligase n=1 Tax=Microthyrium microscopicum TaxID=703497 RepID=A0A6A6U4L7_9PEZI|nr:ATP-dependent DNA ligase [Microthyrium microscopicum]